MTDRESETSDITRSWDTYWHGARDSAAFSSGGSSHPSVLSFWGEYFRGVRDQLATPKIIDIASGNGAVVECALSAFGGALPEFTCLDISAAAIAMLRERFPEVAGVVADASAIPLESACFDIVTSQFGLEYAGGGALDEAARLVAPGGQIALLLHHRHGSIYQQCSASLEAITKMQAANFIPHCLAMFAAAFAVRSGADRAPYAAAAKEMVPAIRAMEAIMQEHGRDVADGTIVRLYRDIRNMHDRMHHHEPAEVLEWLRRMQDEIEAYAGRMDSMCNAAIGVTGFEETGARLRERGFDLLRHEPLAVPASDLALAWALVAERRQR